MNATSDVFLKRAIFISIALLSFNLSTYVQGENSADIFEVDKLLHKYKNCDVFDCKTMSSLVSEGSLDRTDFQLLKKYLKKSSVQAGYARKSSITKSEGQPQNDFCVNAIEVEMGIQYSGTTENATGDSESGCSFSDDRDVWYIFTPTQSGLVSISLSGSSFDTTLAVYDECGGTELACNDDAVGLQSEIAMQVETGSSYLIRIAGFDHDTGDYVLTLNSTTALENDECIDAIEVEVGVSYSGSTRGATGDTTSGCSNSDDLDVWHIFTPTQSEVVSISLLDSEFDTTLAIYDGCGGTELACNDDAGWEVQSEITMQVEGGFSYFIRIAGYDHETGDYVLTISSVAPLDNDNCINASEVQLGVPYEGSLRNATGDGTSSCGFMDNNIDVWHIFTPAQTQVVAITLEGSFFLVDATLSVFNQCDGAELECASGDILNLSGEVEITMQVEAGSSYLIRVGGDETVDYVLTINPAIPPEHDDCVDAISIQEGIPWFGSTRHATGDYTSKCGFSSDDKDVWHIFTPMRSGFFSIRTYADFDTTLAVFDECQGSELACNDNTVTCDDSEISLLMSANTDYFIRVAGHGHESGDYVIEVVNNPLPALDEPNRPYPSDGASNVPVDTVLSWNTTTEQLKDASNSIPSQEILKVIFGTDDRMEEYQVTDEAMLAAGDATAVLVSLEEITRNSDGTYMLSDQTLAEWYSADSFSSLCPNEPYRDQPTPGSCSGFLVGPDIVATAGHCLDCACDRSNFAVVFGFVMLDEETPRLVVSDQDVYFIREVIGLQMGYPDWALLRLDREVVGRNPLPLRQTGRVDDDQPLVVIGYPMGIPRKYDWGGTVRENTQYTFFQANLDTYGGNSGSAVLNLDTMTVEGILVRGFEDFVFDESAGCERSNVLPDDNEEGWEEVTRITALSPLVPSYDVYLGTEPANLELVKSGSSLCKLKPESLRPQTTYYWQVAVRSASRETRGAIWKFRTGE
ncbi:MAG: serine protease [Phycisphaerales bacterium]|jgi:hypothetical protein